MPRPPSRAEVAEAAASLRALLEAIKRGELRASPGQEASLRVALATLEAMVPAGR